MTEEWKDITGYEGVYSISNTGKVWSYKRKDRLGRDRGGKPLNICYAGNGYGRISLKVNGKRRSHLIHRLVLTAFTPRISGKNYVNHIDGDKQNNTVSNLEWCTPYENIHHAIDSGLSKYARGSRQGKAVLNEKCVEIIKRSTTIRNKEIAKIFGIAPNHVSEIRSGRLWKHVIV